MTDIALGSKYTFNNADTGSTNFGEDCASLDNSHIANIFIDDADSFKIKVIVGEIASDGSISYGSEVQVGTNTLTDTSVTICSLDSTHFAVAWVYSSSLFAAVCSVSGTTITVGTIVTVSSSLNAARGANTVGICAVNSTKILVTYVKSTYYLSARAGSIDGTTITLGTEVSSTSIYNNSTTTQHVRTTPKTIDSDKVVVVCMNSNYSKIYAEIITLSGTTITFNEATDLGINVAVPMEIEIIDSTHFVMCYYVYSTYYRCALRQFSVSGNSISYVNYVSASIELSNKDVSAPSITKIVGTDYYIATLCNKTDATVYFWIVSYAGAFTFGNRYDLASTNIEANVSRACINGTSILYCFHDTPDSNKGKNIIANYASLVPNTTNFFQFF
jgi:hypothetical protein